MTEDYRVFGAGHALDDELLDKCYVVVPPGVAHGQPILIGRWGTGKTALLLHRNRELTNLLHKDKPQRLPIWYLEETGIDAVGLQKLMTDCGNEEFLKRVLEKAWFAEILRTMCLILSRLWEHYGSRSDEHWNYVNTIAKREAALKPVWGILLEIADLIGGDDKAKAVSELQDGSKDLFLYSDKVMEAIQKCLEDITDEPIQPVVGIEPIDSPVSELEGIPKLAQAMVNSLLNVYRKLFIPSKHQKIKVQLSIPWHRYHGGELDNPQHLAEYKGRFKWSRRRLRDFMNRRIEYEFEKAGRKFTSKGNVDAWETLFGDKIKNNHCRGDIYEETFNYFLRHTHYRPRDIQRFAREAVLHELAFQKVDHLKELLKKGHVVKEKNVRAAIKKVVIEMVEHERVPEAERRYPDMRDIKNTLYGLACPLSVNNFEADLKRRLKKTSEFTLIMQQLWESGFIGIMLTPLDDSAKQHLVVRFGEACKRCYKVDGKEICKFFLFQHTLDDGIAQLLNQYDQSGEGNHEKVKVEVVLHPMMFEYFGAHPTHDYPIGI